ASVLFTNGFPAAGAMSPVVSVGATLYVTAIVPPAGTVNVPDVPTLAPPLIEIAVTVPPATVADTGTGFGLGAATAVAASEIAEMNAAGHAVPVADALPRSAPASTNTLAPDASCKVNGNSAYLLAMAAALLHAGGPPLAGTALQNVKPAGHRPFMTLNALPVESAEPTRQNMNHPACPAGRMPPVPFTSGS